MNRLCLAPALRRPRIHATRAYTTPSSSGKPPSRIPAHRYSTHSSGKPPQTIQTEPLSTPNVRTPSSVLGTPLANVPQDGFLPDLMQYDKLLDEHSVADFPPTHRAPFANRVIVRNDPSMIIGNFYDTPPQESRDPSRPETLEDRKGIRDEEAEELDDEETMGDIRDTTSESPLTPKQIAKLHIYPLMMRRVTQQTGKGKIHSMSSLVVVGDGNGLVGYGEGKDSEAAVAREKALAKALRSMDYVERFEKRTFWTEIESKFGSTKIILRPRPVGFGLRCNPNIHQVLKAAGIKDASAKVWGSRNPLMVIKGLFRVLQAGHAPLGMGDGVGGGMRRLDKGSGLRNKNAIEKDRGRKMVDLRTL
ncbi:hypothetical protein L210DRAFT_3543470 [Boletus edulis BED1]|uniref:Small ribosomal subunit protein uS5m n=1 Tax=Boletus edulis BED1 TaxID=1328754 RepID=A0AAD4BTF5_BOLED|nr:hypothetical protein L210DRAFT_3543470 [Boletus edulis BED1]